MCQGFKVFHLKGAGDPKLPLPSDYWHLATCLRSIVVTEAEGPLPESLKGHDFMKGEAAYAFLLKVICGLDSPLLGETEVLGQFKTFFRNHSQEFSSHVRDCLDNLNRHAKKIRSQYLQNLGCTSYGSLLRKEIRGGREALTFLGAGSLAQDIFPWFAKVQNPLAVFTRTPENYSDLIPGQANIQLYSYEQMGNHKLGGVLVVAAPLTAQEILSQWDLQAFAKIYDLRGDSEEDRLPGTHVMTLKSLFQNIEENRQQAALTKEKAISAIRQQAGDLSLLERPRPFGWEDLWAYS